LTLNGTIAEESWFEDDVTPRMFRDELNAGAGDVVIWINSPGGDCVAASQIYTMLMDYKGHITVKIDGIAASAASVIAMAGTEVLMAPTSLLMIHNPLTVAIGDSEEMQKAIAMLDEVKESIINAYELKTGMSRAKLAHLMDAETWMNANKAIELGFADGVLEDEKKQAARDDVTFSFSRRAVTNTLLNKIHRKQASKAPAAEETPPPQATEPKYPVEPLYQRLSLISP
jgi:ATP-dependent Clp protease protease subunit